MTNTAPARCENVIRFDGYRVQPVIETTAPDGIERTYQTFPNLTAAQAEIVRFDSMPIIDGAAGQQILWSIYGLRQGIAEHIADRSSEADAFALLLAITGMTGTAGQVDYPLLPLWVVIHEHRSGSAAWVVASPEEPALRQLVRCLRIDYEPQREEFLSGHALDTIDRLDWEDGDDAPIKEAEA